jgi:DNA end-binding protein Ku
MKSRVVAFPESVMPPRPNWKGYLKLSLVSCPIALYPATSGSERISFRQVNKQTGNRLKQQLVDSVSGEPVGPEDKGRGYEVGKNQFLMVEDDELEAIEIESTRTIEIDSFVPRDQIDDRYIDAPYYIAPTDAVGQEAFAVIREAMRGKGMVALGRVVLSKREYVIALEPFEKGLKATTLRYPYEVREASVYFEDIPEMKIPGEMLKLAEHILDSKAADFDPTTFEDRYEIALTEMLRKKQAGVPVPKEAPAAPPANVVNLMDALKRSLQKESGAGGRTRTAAPEKARPQAREPQRATAARKPQKKARRAG